MFLDVVGLAQEEYRVCILWTIGETVPVRLGVGTWQSLEPP